MQLRKDGKVDYCTARLTKFHIEIMIQKMLLCQEI